MMSRVDNLGDTQCVEIALSIAVQVREPRAKTKQTSLGKLPPRCESAPDGLDQLMNFSGRRSPLRRSPTQPRHRFPRRRMSDEACARQPRVGKARVDLGTLDFQMSGLGAEADNALRTEEDTLSIGLNECDITSKGVETISRALSFVSVNDKKPLIELQLAYNNRAPPPSIR